MAFDPVNDPEDAERAFNARTTLDTVKNVAEWFQSVRGRRKTILATGIIFVIGSVVAMLLGMMFGFSTVLAVAGGCYVASLVAARLGGWTGA